MPDSKRSAGFAVLALVAGLALAGLGYAMGQRDPVPAAGDDVRAVHDGLVRREFPSPQPVATSAAAKPPTAKPDPTTIPTRGTGTFVPASGGSGRVGTASKLYRYRVEVEQGSGQSPAEVARSVEATFADPRGWTATNRWAFQRVPPGSPVDFVVRLATPTTVDKLCAAGGLDTGGEVSCQVGSSVIVNLKRWLIATDVYADNISNYRHLVVNHEVGHFLGFGHVDCPGPGKPAPVMQTQIWGLHGCVPNVWPYPDKGV